VVNARSAARSGNTPLPSTCSSRTGSAAPAAATMRGKKHPGCSSVTTRHARRASAASRPRPWPAADSTYGRYAIFAAANARALSAMPLQHERVHAIARPRVAGAQRLEHDQRPAELGGARDRVVEREAPRRAPRGDHPVQDVVAAGRHRGRVHRRDPQARRVHDPVCHGAADTS
jgi:hypothetical protein